MNQSLSNFICIDDVLAAEEMFYGLVAEACEYNAQRCTNDRDAAFLRYVVDATQRLASSLGKHRSEPTEPALQEWLQYTPDEPLPGEPEIWGLLCHGWNPAHALDNLHRTSARWVELHRRLEQTTGTVACKEMQASCRDLLEAWERGLNSAYNQLRDL